MNLKEIREIIKLMNENGLAEVEIEREGGKIKLRKSVEEPLVPRAVAPVPEVPAAASSQPPGAVGTQQEYLEIKSPMIGTFYVAPAPDADPFVKEGDIVEVGQVVAIVEAMKLMNEIKSEIRGRIVKRAVENAQPVEYGQALFLVEPV